MTAAPPLVSILLPARDAAGTIGEALDSLARQTLDRFECLVVDDGSTDDTAERAAALAAGDSRFRLLRQEPLGIVAALQAAAAEASAPLLARMDADDVAISTRLERQFAFLDANPRVALCGCRVETFGESVGPGRLEYQAWLNALSAPEDLRREALIECPVAHPTFVMRRDAYEAVGGYRNEPWPEDYALVLRVLDAGHQIANVPEVLLRWRHHEARLSVRDPRYGEDRFRALKREFLLRWHLPPGQRFIQWGAGDVGKRWLREWGDRAPESVVDVAPRKIGERIHGVPVIAREALPPAGEAFVAVAVGAPGARTLIREYLGARAWREPQDFIFLA